MDICCPQCSESFTPQCEVLSIVCGHVFHANCITKWLERTLNCPKCQTYTTLNQSRKILFTEGETEANILQDTLLKNIELEETNEKLVKENNEMKEKLKTSEEMLGILKIKGGGNISDKISFFTRVWYKLQLAIAMLLNQ